MLKHSQGEDFIFTFDILINIFQLTCNIISHVLFSFCNLLCVRIFPSIPSCCQQLISMCNRAPQVDRINLVIIWIFKYQGNFNVRLHRLIFNILDLCLPFHQTDLFGLVGTLHVLIFGEYMSVYCEGGRWRTTKANFRSVKFNLHLIFSGIFPASHLWISIYILIPFCFTCIRTVIIYGCSLEKHKLKITLSIFYGQQVLWCAHI